jgi:hypothetical protein
MPKSPRHTINLKLSIEEFAALAADADKCGTAPTTMALCHVLAGMQQFRDVVPGVTAPASRAVYALRDAAEALRAAGNAEAAQAAESVAQELFQAVADTREGLGWIVSPGWRLDAYRHRIVWEGPDGGRPDLTESILKSR